MGSLGRRAALAQRLGGRACVDGDGRWPLSVAARVSLLRPQFVASLRRVGALPGSSSYRAILATVRQLTADELPTRGDYEIATPPVGRSWVRRVREENLWVTFTWNHDTVFVGAVLRAPPVPIA